jgi:Carbohydrate-selective porin, OprB family
VFKGTFKLTNMPLVVLGVTFYLSTYYPLRAEIAPLDNSTKSNNNERLERGSKSLQKLNSRYNCLTNPDRIWNNDGSIRSQLELAKAIQSCVSRLEYLVAQQQDAPPPPPDAPPSSPGEQPQSQSEPTLKEDVAELKEIVEAFRGQLTYTDERIQKLEAQTEALKKDSFSTTTKLAGEVILGLSTYGGVQQTATRLGSSTVLTDRVRLNFDTSFTGKDRLRTRLQSRNTTPLNSAVTGTNMTRFGYDGDESNVTSVSLLQYSLPITPETRLIAETVGSEFNENMYTFNPQLTSSGSGSISRFGRFNPVYRQSGDGASITIDHKFSPDLSLALGYAVPGTSAANPASGSGLFGGSNAIISQLSYRPSDSPLDLGLIYARSYHSAGSGVTGGTGSSAANAPFGAVATTANHYSFLASYKLSPSAIVSGWVGLTNATRETAAGGSADISNYALTLAFPDLGQKGNTLGLVVGVPPKLTSRSGTGLTPTPNTDTSLHLEAFYKMKISNNLDLTPGFLVITNPEHNSANSSVYVGTIRTTFKF